MTTQQSQPNRYLIWVFLGGVAMVSYLLLKLIMWLDGVK